MTMRKKLIYFHAKSLAGNMYLPHEIDFDAEIYGVLDKINCEKKSECNPKSCMRQTEINRIECIENKTKKQPHSLANQPTSGRQQLAQWSRACAPARPVLRC